MSGDLHIVDTVMYQFNLTPSLTPDLLVGRLTPYLFGGRETDHTLKMTNFSWSFQLTCSISFSQFLI